MVLVVDDHAYGHDSHDHGHGPVRGQQVGVVEGAAHPPLQQQVGEGVGVPPQQVEVEVGVTLPSANRIAMYDGKIKH